MDKYLIDCDFQPSRKYLAYLRTRILTYLVVWFAALNIVFILPRIAPGTPAEILAAGGNLPLARTKLLEAQFGLQSPISTQYVLFLKNIFLTFPPNFGDSFQYYPNTVTSLFFERLPNTIFLIVTAMVLAIGVSYLVSIFSSVRRGSKIEMGLLYTSIGFHSTPFYWIAMVLLWVFAVTLKVFPVFGGSTSIGPVSGLAYISSTVWHSILPIFAMTLSGWGSWYLLLRGSSQEILKTDYVWAAKARGLGNSTVARRYILRNSLLPVISLASFYIGTLISIAVLVEFVFGFFGVGDLLVDAAVNRDYPLLEGSFFYLTTIIVVAGIIGDIVLRRMDPRLH